MTPNSTKDSGCTWTNPLEIKKPDLDPYYEGLTLTDLTCSESGLHCVLIGNYQTTRINNDETINELTQLAYTTLDGGSSWDIGGYHMSSHPLNEQETGPNILIKIACEKLGKKCIAVGAGEYLTTKIQSENYREESSVAIPYAYLSADGGKNWVRTSKISQELCMLQLMSLSCDNEAESCIASGVRGYTQDDDKFDAIAYITYDSGYSWQLIPIQPSEKNSFFTKIFCDTSSDICHIVGVNEQYFGNE